MKVASDITTNIRNVLRVMKLGHSIAKIPRDITTRERKSGLANIESIVSPKYTKSAAFVISAQGISASWYCFANCLAFSSNLSCKLTSNWWKATLPRSPSLSSLISWPNLAEWDYSAVCAAFLRNPNGDDNWSMNWMICLITYTSRSISFVRILILVVIFCRLFSAISNFAMMNGPPRFCVIWTFWPLDFMRRSKRL